METSTPAGLKAQTQAKNTVLWLFLVSITLLFAALTSAYLVRKDGANWLRFDMPEDFTQSTVVLISSSVTMILGVWLAQKNKWLSGLAILVTLGLGLWFTQLQFEGWKALTASGIFFIDNVNQNVSGSFFYVLTAFHLAHLISGLIALFVVFTRTCLGHYQGGKTAGLRRTAIYWHFLDFLWLYLFLFLRYADSIF
jgi:cytochrome c oxidase subunit 3